MIAAAILALRTFFASVPAWAWRLFMYVAILVGAAVFGALKMHAHDLAKYELLESKFNNYQAEVAAERLVAVKVAAKKKAADDQLKKDSDAQNKAALDRVTAERDRLLHARQSAGYLPPASPGAREPDRACFSRADVESALRQFDADASKLLGEGDAAIADQNTNKGWVKNRSP